MKQQTFTTILPVETFQDYNDMNVSKSILSDDIQTTDLPRVHSKYLDKDYDDDNDLYDQSLVSDNEPEPRVRSPTFVRSNSHKSLVSFTNP